MSTLPSTAGNGQKKNFRPQQAADDSAGIAKRLTWLTFALCLVVTGTIAVYAFAGPSFAAPVGLAGLLATAGWQQAEIRRIPFPASFIVPYLILVMSLLVQNAEEFAARAAGTETPFSVPGFAVYSIGAAAAFMLGACALSLRHTLGTWSAWLVCAWAVLQSLAHYAYPIAASARYAYMPGQWLAWLPFLIGVYGLFRLCRPAGLRSRKGGRSHD